MTHPSSKCSQNNIILFIILLSLQHYFPYNFFVFIDASVRYAATRCLVTMVTPSSEAEAWWIKLFPLFGVLFLGFRWFFNFTSTKIDYLLVLYVNWLTFKTCTFNSLWHHRLMRHKITFIISWWQEDRYKVISVIVITYF